MGVGGGGLGLIYTAMYRKTKIVCEYMCQVYMCTRTCTHTHSLSVSDTNDPLATNLVRYLVRRKPASVLLPAGGIVECQDAFLVTGQPHQSLNLQTVQGSHNNHNFL